MREDLLHFIWKYKKLQLKNLLGSKNESIQILDVGSHNLLSGPDFFNAKIEIDQQLWAGTVEMHIKSSDWYAHNHEIDPNYHNVILHVVWEDDCDVFRSDNTAITTLILKDYISSNILLEYQKLFYHKGKAAINCSNEIGNIDDFVLQNWLEVLYFERLEKKTNQVDELLIEFNNDWEQVFFILLAKNFGLKINGEVFFEIAKQLQFPIVRKIQGHPLQLESVLYGLAGLLEDDTINDDYFKSLKSEFVFLKAKYTLLDTLLRKPEFFKLRPSNFPTIRLSQLANLYTLQQSIFSKVIGAKSAKEIYSVFKVTASEYWDNHYTFGKISKNYSKKLSRKFVDLLIINTILPIKLSYAKHLGRDVNEEIINIISDIASESNTVISKFGMLKLQFPSAKESQAVLQLYNEYCTKNKCLQCAVGHQLLNRKP
ncbi:DUF2851 domain-containing protein [Arenibacter sp. TNZ]|jgi:hypothetical protein|uniref:DUF2851 family protein n=1 Tax=Arenibacter TaxID=178469 RepID=UPI000CD4019A|nr:MULTISPECIES: DUF2851 family protein [Arenibacter]MCM4173163.1 DUF2851 domain-containing protein [Arenibacter sp. TNZ]